MLTRAGRFTIAAGLLAIVFGRILALDEVVLVGATAPMLVVVAAVWLRLGIPHLTITRTVTPREIPQGGQAAIRIEVTNTGRHRSPVVQLLDPLAWHDHEGDQPAARIPVGRIAPHAADGTHYVLDGSRRGLLSLGPMTVAQSDPFGLLTRRRSGPGPTQLIVTPSYPVVEAPPRASGDRSHGVTLRGRPVPATGHDFASLRDYVRGDDLRRVHWATTARRGQLTVRNDDQVVQTRTTIVLDIDARAHDTDTFEETVSAAAALAAACLARGDETRLVSTGGLDTLPGTGPGHLDIVLRELAVVAPAPDTSLIDTVAPLTATPEVTLVVLGTDRSRRPERGQTTSRIARIDVVFPRSDRPVADDADDPTELSRVRAARGDVVVGPEGFVTAWERFLTHQPRLSRIGR